MHFYSGKYYCWLVWLLQDRWTTVLTDQPSEIMWAAGGDFVLVDGIPAFVAYEERKYFVYSEQERKLLS